MKTDNGASGIQPRFCRSVNLHNGVEPAATAVVVQRNGYRACSVQGVVVMIVIVEPARPDSTTTAPNARAEEVVDRTDRVDSEQA